MRNEMIFFMGLPASGKSKFAKQYAATHVIIDPDAIKMTHPEYDPKDPNAIHEWSSMQEELQFSSALNSGVGQYVIDGTGTNAEKMVRRMTEAKARGFAVSLIYVTVSLQTSIARNAARVRVVPEYVIREKSMNIATSFQIVAPHADTVKVIDND